MRGIRSLSRILCALAIAASLTLGSPQPAAAGAELPTAGSGLGGVRLSLVGRFALPVQIAQPRAGSNDLVVVELGGRIRTVRRGRVLRTPFLDIRRRVRAEGEMGLFSVAFAPDHATSRRLYVAYSAADRATIVASALRSRARPSTVDRTSIRTILRMPQSTGIHKGGQLAFGPDGYLYISTGDGGLTGARRRGALDPDSLRGKLLRIDPSRREHGLPYGIPAGNPFVGTPGRDEVYALGFRNPWRFSFDRLTGDIFIGDVGQDRSEEIDHIKATDPPGQSFGWPAMEGNEKFDSGISDAGQRAPIHTYGRLEGQSVVGGFVVRDPRLRTLWGRYLYGDFEIGAIRSFRVVGGNAQEDRAPGPVVRSLTGFGEDSRGRIYAASISGPVYRLDPPRP